MVTPREMQWVKSNWASRPGGCSWGKYTSRSGPCSALQSCNRRCSVRSWDALNRGCCSASQSIIVVPSACQSDHSVAAARSHPPTPRRRGRDGCATDAPVSLATAMGHSATCALNARSSQPWPLPFPVSCLPYVSASLADLSVCNQSAPPYQLITLYRPVNIVVATGRTNCRLSPWP